MNIIHVYTHMHVCIATVCALQVSVHTFPLFSTEEELSLEYNLIIIIILLSD